MQSTTETPNNRVSFGKNVIWKIGARKIPIEKTRTWAPPRSGKKLRLCVGDRKEISCRLFCHEEPPKLTDAPVKEIPDDYEGISHEDKQSVACELFKY